MAMETSICLLQPSFDSSQSSIFHIPNQPAAQTSGWWQVVPEIHTLDGVLRPNMARWKS